MLEIRKATLADLDFLVGVDLNDQGITHPSKKQPSELAEHRKMIADFVTGPEAAAWVIEETPSGQLVGTILYRFRDRYHEERNEANEFLFRFLDESWLPPDGRFCEVFNLCIHPSFRRKRLATVLKQLMEIEARQKGYKVLYTHTEEQNEHVIRLNQKLGYREIRRGPMGEDVVKVSLVKNI
jgi:RimJ/RimL family protein N-acetyltransferase